MELELGLKITQTKDDQSSITDLRMLKDSLGPIFMSRETQSKFILTAHLKGFVKEHIGIRINEDGTRIFIRLEKPVQETVMSNWMVRKKEVQLKGFIRAFRIPSGVVLDRIKANFNDHESLLTILLPKSVKGLRGGGIEEVNEEESTHREIVEQIDDGDATMQISTIKSHEDHDEAKSSEEDKTKTKFQKAEHSKASNSETEIDGRSREMEDQTQKPEVRESDSTDSLRKVEEELLEDIEAMIFSTKHDSDRLPEKFFENGNNETGNEAQKTEKVGEEHGDQNKEESNVEESSQKSDTRKVKEELLEDIEAIILSRTHDSDCLPEENANTKIEDEARETEMVGEEHGDRNLEEAIVGESSPNEEKQKKPNRRKMVKLCRPCVIAGSTIFVSLVVIAIHWIRSRKRQVQ